MTNKQIDLESQFTEPDVSSIRTQLHMNCPAAQVTKKERKFITALATHARGRYPERRFLNIGVLWGCTLYCLQAGDPDALIIGVDIDCSKIWKPLHLNARLVTGDSKKVEIPGDFHIVLIDGDHHYETISVDIARWVPRLVKGGFVIFHDYNPKPVDLHQFPELKDVRRAINEWVRLTGDDEWKYISSPDSLFVAQRV